MKKRTIVMTVLVALLLASCVVKSLKPFYTKDTLAYDGSLLGEWEDNKDNVWEVLTMKSGLDSVFMDKKKQAEKVEEIIQNHNNEVKSVNMSGEVKVERTKKFADKELEEIYENAYIFVRKVKLSKEEAFFRKEKEEVKSAYIVVPFKIKGQVFLDFTPLEVKELQSFEELHHIGIHTLAKLDKKGEDLKLTWLSEEKIKQLFKEKKIRISHEKIGFNKEDILLTASSEDLQKFIAKYMDLEQKDKWDGTRLTFKRIK